MKIIITEDQLKRVLLKEENNTLYKVKELDIESSGFDHYEGKNE